MSLLDVSATRSADGATLHVAVINRSATEAITAQLDLGGATLPSTATARTIGAATSDLFAVNHLGAPLLRSRPPFPATPPIDRGREPTTGAPAEKGGVGPTGCPLS